MLGTYFRNEFVDGGTWCEPSIEKANHSRGSYEELRTTYQVYLAVKSSNGGSDKSRDNKLTTMPEKDEPPTLDELKLWGESFEKLMKCSGGRKLFREFLRSEYSEENMLFYLACEDLKKEDNPELIEEKARLIYEDYISILSPKEGEYPCAIRVTIKKWVAVPGTGMKCLTVFKSWSVCTKNKLTRITIQSFLPSGEFVRRTLTDHLFPSPESPHTRLICSFYPSNVKITVMGDGGWATSNGRRFMQSGSFFWEGEIIRLLRSSTAKGSRLCLDREIRKVESEFIYRNK
ncbi:Regulator of G-protein signaling 17 [Bulinus truncatus]|nr:Regulator of G-protein signaling 17 [Bulinus truncatus]